MLSVYMEQIGGNGANHNLVYATQVQLIYAISVVHTPRFLSAFRPRSCSVSDQR